MSVTLALIPVAIAVAGAIASRTERPQDASNSSRFETKMRDETLLERALGNHGCRTVVTGDENVDSALGETRIRFERDERGVFEAVFVGDIAVDEAQGFLEALDEEYALLVQQQVYENLLLRARKRGLVMEFEEVQDDNSIVLTFEVQEGR